MKTKKIVLVSCVLAFFIFLIACNKNGEDESASPIFTETVSTTITGRIVDEQHNALANVTVTCNGVSTTTSSYGTFTFKNISVPKSRFIIKYIKPGFFDGSYAHFVNNGQSIYVTRVMLAKGSSYAFQTATGGSLTINGGASIQFPANAYVLKSNGNPYTGTVNVYAKHLCVDSSNFIYSIPGNDLSGVDKTGEIKKLVSYGMAGVELFGSSGEPLNLSATGTAQLSMPVALSQLSNAPAQIPMWYFNEANAIWQEDGMANLTGNSYVGSVKHFSWWNWDQAYSKAYVKGKVFDCDGIGLQNALITSNSILSGNLYLTTDAQGEYFDSVPAGYLYNITASIYNYSSITFTTPVLTAGTTYSCPDIIFSPCPGRVMGTMIDCNGNAGDGLVICNNSYLNNYYNTTNGKFSFLVDSNSFLNLSFYRQNNYYSMTLPNPGPGLTSDVGIITVCNAIAVNNLPDNTLVFDGGPFSNYICIVDSFLTDNYVIATVDLNNRLRINFNKPSLISMIAQANDTVPGDYTYTGLSTNYNFFEGNLSVGNLNYFLSSDSSICTGKIAVLESANIGGRVKGTIGGSLYGQSTGTPNQKFLVNVTGKFNAKRQ